MNDLYQVTIHYGYEQNEDGEIYHAVLATDPSKPVNETAVAAELADLLDLMPEDDTFSWGSMDINLPESLVKQIQVDAVNKYIQQKGKI